jgi:hypothetical protein
MNQEAWQWMSFDRRTVQSIAMLQSRRWQLQKRPKLKGLQLVE